MPFREKKHLHTTQGKVSWNDVLRLRFQISTTVPDIVSFEIGWKCPIIFNAVSHPLRSTSSMYKSCISFHYLLRAAKLWFFMLFSSLSVLAANDLRQ